jgi:BrnA antitoxin of type II toxin-antitoxin system
MAGEKPDTASTDFHEAAAASAPEPPKVMVSLPIDVDVLAWFQSESEPSGWQRRINDLLRFHMDSILHMEANYAAEDELAARIGQETAAPEPA